MKVLVPILALACVAAGCAQRAAPYRFRGPLVSGVEAGELPPPGDDSLPRAEPLETSDAPVRASSAPRTATRPVIARRAPRPSASPRADHSAPGGPLADALRSMVGLREREATPLSFALSALATVGADLEDEVRQLADGPALLAFAEQRGATSSSGEALLGDLIVFDGVTDRKPASAIGVVVGAAADGTVEFVYLARGVVRRGYLNLDRPHDKRDGNGRALNVILRQKDGNGSKGHGDLAGERFRAFIHLDGLSAR